MNEYQEWFKNKFGFDPYSATLGVREVDTLVAVRQYLIEGGNPIPKELQIVTEAEWQAEVCERGYTREQIQKMAKGTV